MDGAVFDISFYAQLSIILSENRSTDMSPLMEGAWCVLAMLSALLLRWAAWLMLLLCRGSRKT